MLRKLIVTALMALLLASGISPASAQGDCAQVWGCNSDGQCGIGLGCPSEDGGDEETPGTVVVKCLYQGVEIPCTGSSGRWSNSHGCWLRVDPIQEAPPEGKKDEDGDWYICTPPPPYIEPTGGAPTVWIEDGTTWVDPGVLAAEAFETMTLATPDVQMAPRPPLQTYVGLDTWLWMDAAKWAPLTASASAGGATVTATATPVRSTWNLTDGRARCNGPGRPWVNGMSEYEKTTCFYRFQTVSDAEPDDEFPITAKVIYRVDWVCTGPCTGTNGSLGEVSGPAGASAISVGERQSVVIRGSQG